MCSTKGIITLTMVEEICPLLICANWVNLLTLQTGVFILLVLIAGVLLGFRYKKLASGLLGLTTAYGIIFLAISFGPESLMLGYGLEHLFSIRLMSFISHSTVTLVSIFLFCAALGKRFSHDSFLYVASGIGVLVVNIVSIVGRFTIEHKLNGPIPGDDLGLTVMSILAGLLLIIHARLLSIEGPFRLRRSLVPLAVFSVSLISILFLSFKLQRDEIDLLRNTEALFVNNLQLSIKETIDNEVIPLNLLMDLRNAKINPPNKVATLDVARGVLFSRQVMQSLFWITPRGRLAWSIKKDEADKRENRLIKPANFYTKVTEQADIAIVLSEDLSIDGRVEIVVPYVTEGVIRAYVVAQLDFIKILNHATEQIQSTRFNYGFYSQEGHVVASNISSIMFPIFTHKTNFDIFGKAFTVITSPNLMGLGDFITFLPKFTMLFGFIAVLVFAHLIYVYSNLMTSYDQVELLVKERTVQLEASRRIAEAASETKSLFLANISHEVRTPLNILSGVSEMLDETKLSKQQQHLVRMFKQSCTNLLQLVNDLLDMSKVESGKIELEKGPFNLKEFIDEILSLYRIKAAEKSIHLVSNMTGLNHIYFEGDVLRLKQIIGNILINAIKFTDKGAVTLTVLNLGDKVVFKITDTGIGIPEEKLDSIFERFEQIDKTITRNKGGAGLGLAIAKDLVKLMEGQISVQSEKGHGTIFTVEINLAMVDEKQALESMPAADSKIKSNTLRLPQGLKVLITDDSADNRELVKIFLKNYNLEIEEAENGLVALDKIKTKHYDVILMDMQMPVMDGYSAVKKVREYEATTDTRRSPILALTAHALREDNQKCIIAGCDDYLSKPVSKTQLVEKLASLI